MFIAADYLFELSNNNILYVNRKQADKKGFGITLFQIDKDKKIIQLSYIPKYDNVIGCYQLKNNNILYISSILIKYYKVREKRLEKYDDFILENIFMKKKLKRGEFWDNIYFRNSFLITTNDNDDNVGLLSEQQLYIVNHKNKVLIKKIDFEKKEKYLFKYLIISNDYTLIYHKKKIILFDNKKLEFKNYYTINDYDEITCVENLKEKNLILYGTYNGKMYIYNYLKAMNIREISFDVGNFCILWIKVLSEDLFLINYPKNRIIFVHN